MSVFFADLHIETRKSIWVFKASQEGPLSKKIELRQYDVDRETAHKLIDRFFDEFDKLKKEAA